MTGPYGLLLAMMQPPPAMEEEFHDWYDTEHIPERAAIDGFLNAQRFVCLHGYPRFVAVYDLTHPGVLDEGGYKAVSGERFSAWSKRILTRVNGQFRAAGVQIHPGNAVHFGKGRTSRMLLVRFKGLDDSDGAVLIERMSALCDRREDVVQIRIWRCNPGADPCYIAMVEAETSLTADNFQLAGLGELRPHVDLVNLYTPYWRRGALHGVYEK